MGADDKDDKEDKALLDDLERESKEFDKDAEIDRILGAFKLNAYEVLGLLPGVPEKDVKMCYRKKSLLIHPDKTSNPKAPDAFDRLKKAQTMLLEEKERERLDEVFADARRLVMRDEGWTVDSPELKDDYFMRKLWPEKAKQVLIDDELQRRKRAKAQMQEEGRQQRKDEEELAERKRKRDHQESWEKTREQRIGSWRDFQNGKKGEDEGKKKKKKLKPIG